MQALRVAGASGAAAADLGMLRMSDPRLADESEIEPIVCVSVFVRVCGAVRLLSRARFRLQHAAASAS